MQHEGDGFGLDEALEFLDEARSRERDLLVGRLRAAAVRLKELGTRVTPGTAGPGWSGQEVLAHMASFAPFYGIVADRVGSGALASIDIGEIGRMRDGAIEQFAQSAASVLAEQTAAALERTAGYLSTAPISDLERRVDVAAGVSLSSIEVARYLLCDHLESHLAQLEGSTA